MRLVADTNIIFSFFWNDSYTKRLLLNPSLELYSPEFLLKELDKYSKEVMLKTRISEKQYDEFKARLSDVITLVNDEQYSGYLGKAKLICPIWSNDKGLKMQSLVNVISTSELIKMFNV